MLLLHGTGASTHSWRDLAPLLAARLSHHRARSAGSWLFVCARRADAIASRHGARRRRPARRARRCRLRLSSAIRRAPPFSARLALDRAIAPKCIIALNGALTPFEGVAGRLLPTLAKALFLNPVAPRYFAWSANRGAVARLLDGTGSTIDARGVALYARLMRNPRPYRRRAWHDGALGSTCPQSRPTAIAHADRFCRRRERQDRSASRRAQTRFTASRCASFILFLG